MPAGPSPTCRTAPTSESQPSSRSRESRESRAESSLFCSLWCSLGPNAAKCFGACVARPAFAVGSWSCCFRLKSPLSRRESQPSGLVSLVAAGRCAVRLHTSPLVQTPALRAVGNIVTGDDNQTQARTNGPKRAGSARQTTRNEPRCEGDSTERGVAVAPQASLPCEEGSISGVAALSFPRLHHSQAIRKESCWTISNITAGNREQIQEAGECGVSDTDAVHRSRIASHSDLRKMAKGLSSATRSSTMACSHRLLGVLHRRHDALTCPVHSTLPT